MSLTDVAVRNCKPSQKITKLFDERGLYLQISPNGGKWWRLKYRFEGKEKKLSLGVYPDVGLKEARRRRDAARELVAGGVDPSENRKTQKAAQVDRAGNSFEVTVREWITERKLLCLHARRILVQQIAEVSGRIVGRRQRKQHEGLVYRRQSVRMGPVPSRRR